MTRRFKNGFREGTQATKQIEDHDSSIQEWTPNQRYWTHA
eukprot:CAMPEP_0168832164 /NCGR_PEP_ID=MMETSP0727-20121128/2415_1 /TAXON_ID=265536 /ORGANISM="Amphiprora sp., Strain CCMP467" /LENGTH=39 /DNA_ID= /DNA_START= /DNA_END= /DNA_ORIENTATION=